MVSIKKRANEEEQIELLTTEVRIFSDGKKYGTDCSDTEGILLIIQSIPSPKAEPFKRWMAKVGSERIEEINNSELTIERIKQYIL